MPQILYVHPLRPATMVGLIETEDGDTVEFESFGMFTKPEEEDPLWRQTAFVRFSTSNEKYEWMNNLTGYMRGAFDSSTYLHHYEVFGQMDG